MIFHYSDDDGVIYIDEACTAMYEDELDGVYGTFYKCQTLWDPDERRGLSDLLADLDGDACVLVSRAQYAPELVRTMVFVPEESPVELSFFEYA